MPTPQEVLKDPQFHALPYQERRKVLVKIDPDFANLNVMEQDKVLNSLTGMSKEATKTAVESSIPPPAPEKGFVESIPEIGGGIVGGVVGGMAGGFPGAVIGAGVGAGGGEALRQVGQHAFGDPKAPQSVGEAAMGIGKAAAIQGGLEATGQVAVRGVQKLLAPFAKQVTPEAKMAIDALKGKLKQPLLPAEATENRILDILQNISEYSLVGGGKITKFKLKRAEFLDDMADDIIGSFGPRIEADVAGELFIDVIEGKGKAFTAAANAMYNEVERLTKGTVQKVPIIDRVTNVVTGYKEEVVGGAKISLNSVKNFARPLVKTAKELGGVEARNAGDDLVEAIMGLPDEVDFAVAKELRSRLISRVDEFSVANKKAPAIGKAKKFIELVDNETTKGLAKHDPKALKAWRDANEFYRTGKEEFDNAFIRRLVKSGDPDLGGQPETIVRAIFKKNAITNIRRVKKAIDAPTFEKLKSYFIQDMFSQATNPKTGQIAGDRLSALMTGKSGYGEKMLKEVFSPVQYKNIGDFANALTVSQKMQAEGTGRMLIQLTQGGAVFALGSKGMTSKAFSILGGPPAVAWLLTNPTTAKWLIQGVTLPANSPQAAGVIAKLIYSMAAFSKKDELNEPYSTLGR